MSTCFYDYQDALDYVQEEGRWNWAITHRGWDGDGTYWVVDCLRMFDLEGQQQLPHEFREPFAGEVFDIWYGDLQEACHDFCEEDEAVLSYEQSPPYISRAPAGWPFPTQQEH